MKKFVLIAIALLGFSLPAAADFVICANGVCIGDGRIRDDRYDRRDRRDRYDRNRGFRGQDYIRCESRDGRRNSCRIDNFRSRGVRIVDQHSNTTCRYGQNWGYSSNSIWVDDGCRATFRVVRY
jgi:hypothetical protein